MHEHTVRVPTASGTVEGFARNGVNRWRAIPYAKPPVGPLRLRAPQPVEPWRGVRYCHSVGSCAPQRRMYTLLAPGRYQPMSEDCLTLNVVAPQTPPDGPLPVMFFVHGGAYFMGSSATPLYDGAALARRGCVYVSANYRLNALGCLDLTSLSDADHTFDDNLFLRDLVMALQWVRDNIGAFGGDPDNVTIFGESAGAHAVATLMAVPAAKDLFAQVISESPAAGMIRTPEIATQFAAKFAALLGAGEADAAKAVMAARPSELVTAFERLMAEGQRDMIGAFAAGPTAGSEYLPVDPVEAMRDGTAHQVPLIVGTNAEEARLFSRWLKLLPLTEVTIERLLSNSEPAERERITAAYPGYPDPRACLQFGSDFAFGSAAWQIAEAHSLHAPTYLYRYDYAPRTLRWSGFGATHATELFAVFDVYRSTFGRVLTAAADRRSALRVSNDVQSRWRSFARTGVPGDDWPAYTSVDRAVRVFDRKPRIEYDPHAQRRQAWEGFTLAGR